jgi:hypothetical protein
VVRAEKCAVGESAAQTLGGLAGAVRSAVWKDYRATFQRDLNRDFEKSERDLIDW